MAIWKLQTYLVAGAFDRLTFAMHNFRTGDWWNEGSVSSRGGYPTGCPGSSNSLVGLHGVYLRSRGVLKWYVLVECESVRCQRHGSTVVRL